MPKQRDSLRKRLARAIDRVRKPNPLLALLRVPEPTIELDYSDKRVRGIAADVALTLGTGPSDAPLREAFEKFGLDPRDPFDWQRLLWEIARVLFDQHAPHQRSYMPTADLAPLGSQQTSQHARTCEWVL